MTHWFTADSHLGHTGILKHHPNRPGAQTGDIAEHDKALIHNWNSVVKPGVIVHHVGDFSWRDPEKYLKKLNGQIHLTVGNHDRFKAHQLKAFASVHDISKVKVEGQLIYLCHYSMRIWNRAHFGTWHLYGHSHGSLRDDPHSFSFDVGMDCHNYRPISFQEVAALMAKKKWKARDHHAPPAGS